MLTDPDIQRRIIDGLNASGYPFQQRCLDELQEVPNWRITTNEYPVSVLGQDTKIDIVLKSNQFFLIIECKRADPNYLRWVFPEQVRNVAIRVRATQLYIQEIRGNETFRQGQRSQIKPEPVSVLAHVNDDELRVASWGLEVLTRVNKNSGRSVKPSRTEAIEDACYQVFKGLGGFVLEQVQQLVKHPETGGSYFLPVIVTTANLYTAQYDVSKIDLGNGKLPQEEANLEEAKWLVLDYGVGDSIQVAPVSDVYVGRDPEEIRKRYKSKGVLVVNAVHLKEFFSRLYINLET